MFGTAKKEAPKKQVLVRQGNEQDLPALLDLITELAIYEKAPEEVQINIEDLRENGFSKNKVFEFNVAELDGKIAGIALYYYGYSTWKGKMLYLEDIIVTEKLRRYGIGQKLFDSIIFAAKKNNVQQIRWQVLDWNTPAIEFYKKISCKFESEWLNCKLNNKQIKSYSTEDESI